MFEIITAVYEKGLLRPLSPLPLTEHQTVRIQVLPHEPVHTADDVVPILVAAGLMRPPGTQRTMLPDPVSKEERRELAEILGRVPGKPLSEIVIEERGER